MCPLSLSPKLCYFSRDGRNFTTGHGCVLGAGRLKGKAQSLWRNKQFGGRGVDLLGARLEPEGQSLLSVREGLFPRACCSLISRLALTSAPGKQCWLVFALVSVTVSAAWASRSLPSGYWEASASSSHSQRPGEGPKVGWNVAKSHSLLRVETGNCAFARAYKERHDLEECLILTQEGPAVTGSGEV